jgi:hypothetical protein
MNDPKHWWNIRLRRLLQPHAGTLHPVPVEKFGGPFHTVISEEGYVYEPWTDGHAVGFRVSHPDGRVQYIYLNPSSSDTLGEATVFLYQGEHGDPALDMDACNHHYVLFDTEDPPT